ncbi:MAG: hypothetical protein EOM20_00410 [Spartobacteria bacterium]|nr:hypothetical protein [Spartobacteria bacterium]
MSEYFCYKTASILSRALPRPMGYWCGLRLADHFYHTRHKDRAAVINNLTQIYKAQGTIPSKDTLEGQARKTFQYFGKYLVDFFRFSQVTRDEIEHLISIQHNEYFEEVLQREKGVIILTAHFGNWEFGGAVLSGMGYNINAVFLPQNVQKLDALFERQRRRRGVRVVPLGHSASSVIRCLKKGEMVALLGDRDFTPRNDLVEFFGREARMPRGPSWLSWRLGAPILPSFVLRQVDDTFLARFHPPIYPEDMDSEDAIRERICRVLEQEIGENPHQWFIFDDFWSERTSNGNT